MRMKREKKRNLEILLWNLELRSPSIPKEDIPLGADHNSKGKKSMLIS